MLAYSSYLKTVLCHSTALRTLLLRSSSGLPIEASTTNHPPSSFSNAGKKWTFASPLVTPQHISVRTKYCFKNVVNSTFNYFLFCLGVKNCYWYWNNTTGCNLGNSRHWTQWSGRLWLVSSARLRGTSLCFCYVWSSEIMSICMQNIQTQHLLFSIFDVTYSYIIQQAFKVKQNIHKSDIFVLEDKVWNKGGKCYSSIGLNLLIFQVNYWF